jgi:hypothetical protein
MDLELKVLKHRGTCNEERKEHVEKVMEDV